MEIYGASIEQILEKNNGLADNFAIIGVGIEVITKPFNSDKPFFYKANLNNLYKKDLDSFCNEEHIKTGKKFERYVVAVKANAKILIEKFNEDSKENVLIEVLEKDLYMTKLVNVSTIQEVRTFVFDSQGREFNK